MFASSRPFSRSTISLRSDVSDATTGVEVRERFPIDSRLCLPSASGDLEKPALPSRQIGTLTYVNQSTQEFNVYIKPYNVDFAGLLRQINACFTDVDEDAGPAEQERNEFGLLSLKPKHVRTGAIYAAKINVGDFPDVSFFRVKIVKRYGQKKVLAYVMDVGLEVELSESSLLELPGRFYLNQFGTRLSLRCQLPDERLLDGAPFPKLENFKVNDHVEVYILSEDEPCLAVLGSLTTGPNSISRDLLSREMENLSIDPLNRTLSASTLPAAVNVYKGWAPHYWTHASTWTLVTVLSSENPEKVAVRDVFTSLRFCYLQQAVNRSYKKQEYRHAMKVDPSKLFVGSPAITFYKPLNSYIRGNITNMNLMEGSCDFEALDIPDVTILRTPLNRLCYPSALLLEVPPQVFIFNVATAVMGRQKRLKCFDPLICAEISPEVEKLLVPNSVAIMKLSEIGAEFENNEHQNVRKHLDKQFYSKKLNDFGKYESFPTSRATSICENEDWD